MERYKAIGLMSGTSLDGLDIAACEFVLEGGKWSYKFHFCQTAPYSAEWSEKLKALHLADALTFSVTNMEYGHLLGRLTRSVMENTGFHPDLVASHGHTVFHQPERGLTVQIGSGSAIAAETGIPVICDFRSADLALGGQGAPLVPIGDRMLFSEFGACLNLGGFANISMEKAGVRIAFDICPSNIILNRLSEKLGYSFDTNGELARSGSVIPGLLEKLNHLEYYEQSPPKSLGREWLETVCIPVLSAYHEPVQNLLRTFCEHIAIQVNRSLTGRTPCKVLATGGGVHNNFLMDLITMKGMHHWIIPENQLTDFKEALIFAFLGVLRWKNNINVLHSVTGSRTDHSAGAIHRLI
jgi:anhydro-N-acetylmuramic acid kinase